MDKKEYYRFLKILCGIERLEQLAKIVFKIIKADGFKPANYRGNGLYKEAAMREIDVNSKKYRVDPRFFFKRRAIKFY